MTPETLAALCDAAMPDERLTPDELRRICFGDGDTVVGDELAAAVYTVKRFGDHAAAWLLLIAVHPEQQGRGLGKDLVRAVGELARTEGARELHLASAVPRYVWPGVDVFDTRAGAFFEGLGFDAGALGVNMSISTAWRHDPPPGVVIEREVGDGAVAFAQRAFPHWVEELVAAIDGGTAFAARSEDGTTIGFCCHSVNRHRWIGPMATDPDFARVGVGSATLSAVCADLAASDVTEGEIAWVSNVRFYGKCTARVSRVFRGGRITLARGVTSARR